MDWFSWLSKTTTLDPTLVYEYGLTFVQNQLEEDDIAYFNHEFLQSMGISVAKHRLEIIKLAKKHQTTTTTTKAAPPAPRSVTRFLVAIKRTKRRVSKYILRRNWNWNWNWIGCEEAAGGLALVPLKTTQRSLRWRSSSSSGMLRRNKKTTEPKQGRLLLTNGGGGTMLWSSCSSRFDGLSSSMVVEDDDDDDEKMEGDGDKYWSSTTSVVEDQIRWDAMFQDLKPT